MTTPPFQILHHGAVRGVTGSCHELRLVGPLVGPASAGQCPHECGPTGARMNAEPRQKEKPTPITGPLMVRSSESLPFSKS